MNSLINKTTYKLFAVTLLLTLSFTTKTANSQNVANGTAIATVAAAMAVTSAQNLLFGTIFQGVAKSIANDVNAASGIFNITGAASSGITISFNLPDYIALADGSDRMPISFSITDAVVDTNNTTPSGVVGGDGWINQDPRNLPAATVIGSGGQTNTYLGGRITPSIDQKAGAYTGAIVLSVAYNGT